jgi:abequosyltransferase
LAKNGWVLLGAFDRTVLMELIFAMVEAKDISVVVPAYNRPNELVELLESVLQQQVMPGEVVIVEDHSPEREKIRNICESYATIFEKFQVGFKYIENEQNLGFDHNLRKCLRSPQGKWALLLGNDDILLPNAIEDSVRFLSVHDVLVASRTFVRFDYDVNEPLGVSRIADHDAIFKQGFDPSKMIFRSGAFIGGLLFNVEFCRANETELYDGTLYYQIYLFALAFCQRGIGYISQPIAGGRAGNPPMFGAADNENDVHVPGGFTAVGRGKMWESVLRIVGDVEQPYGVNLLDDIRHELTVRQSFHIFEMNAGAGYKANRDLARELNRLGLFAHPVPLAFFIMNIFLGARAARFYGLARRILQSS